MLRTTRKHSMSYGVRCLVSEYPATWRKGYSHQTTSSSSATGPGCLSAVPLSLGFSLVSPRAAPATTTYCWLLADVRLCLRHRREGFRSCGRGLPSSQSAAASTRPRGASQWRAATPLVGAKRLYPSQYCRVFRILYEYVPIQSVCLSRELFYLRPCLCQHWVEPAMDAPCTTSGRI